MEQGIKSGADILMIGAKPLQVQFADGTASQFMTCDEVHFSSPFSRAAPVGQRWRSKKSIA